MKFKEKEDSLTLTEWKMIKYLPFTKRQVQCLWRYYWLGYKQREIAGDIGVCQQMVSAHLSRARSQIAEHFGISTGR